MNTVQTQTEQTAKSVNTHKHNEQSAEKTLAVLTHKGIEDICQTELQELGVTITKTDEQIIIGKTKAVESCVYFCQSATRICEYISFAKEIALLDLTIIDSTKTYCIHPLCFDENQEKAKQMGSRFFHELQMRAKLEQPQDMYILFETVSGFYLLKDLLQKNVSKREYGIFLTSRAIKAPIAYALVRLSGYTPKSVFIDPNCSSGMIPIEAALYASGTSHLAYAKDIPYTLAQNTQKKITGEIRGFDSNIKHIEFSKKNAKIAGIGEFVSFSRVNIDWLDLKLADASVDCVALSGWNFADTHAHKYYQQFFERISSLVKKKAKIVICAHHIFTIKDSIPPSLQIIHERTIMQGQMALEVIILQKNTAV
jgi:23S rRNA G2445 N2-methylase RlmL